MLSRGLSEFSQATVERAAPRRAGTNQWNLVAGTWAKVTGITPSPNLWHAERPLLQHGRHTFFLLEGCRDTTEGRGRGFFTETLRSELHSVRSPLEAYNASATIEGGAEAQAAGLGMTDQKPWALTLRVRTASTVATFLIDRQD